MSKNDNSQKKSSTQDALDSLVQSLEEYKENMDILAKRINAESLFIVYKRGLGDSPEFLKIRIPEEILKRAKQIRGIFRQNGSVNTNSKHIENYALCLVHLSHFKKAKLLFDAIYDRQKTVTIKPENISDLSDKPSSKVVGRRPKSLLFLHQKKKGLIYQSEATADRSGQLGYEGLYQYAVLCWNEKDNERAKELFTEIITKISTYCPPDRLLNIRVAAIKILLIMGVTHLGKLVLSEELKRANFHRY